MLSSHFPPSVSSISLYLFISLSISLYLSISISLSLSIYLYLYLYLSISLYLYINFPKRTLSANFEQQANKPNCSHFVSFPAKLSKQPPFSVWLKICT
ncbi:MAG: hypothetical protein ACTS4U_00005 [Candidatus Hodgkinia cicadicola]